MVEDEQGMREFLMRERPARDKCDPEMERLLTWVVRGGAASGCVNEPHAQREGVSIITAD
jgi:hypothetical protein